MTSVAPRPGTRSDEWWTEVLDSAHAQLRDHLRDATAGARAEIEAAAAEVDRRESRLRARWEELDTRESQLRQIAAQLADREVTVEARRRELSELAESIRRFVDSVEPVGAVHPEPVHPEPVDPVPVDAVDPVPVAEAAIDEAPADDALVEEHEAVPWPVDPPSTPEPRGKGWIPDVVQQAVDGWAERHQAS